MTDKVTEQPQGNSAYPDPDRAWGEDLSYAATSMDRLEEYLAEGGPQLGW